MLKQSSFVCLVLALFGCSSEDSSSSSSAGSTTTSGSATSGSTTSGGVVSTTTGVGNSSSTTSATTASTTTTTTGGSTQTCVDPSKVSNSGAAANFSFFVTSYHQLVDLAGNNAGFGGDLRYNGATTGLAGADAICQELACRVGFGHRTWKAFLSTSTENAKDRIGVGPWYDFAGNLVANDVSSLLSGERPGGGCCSSGTYDEQGLFHDGSTDQNNDGVDDDDHDTMTSSNEDGTYAGFSCEDWTSVTAQPENTAGSGGPMGGGPGGGLSGGIIMGHSWPAQSGQSWVSSHGGHGCAAGTNFVQNGPGDTSTVGGGGGYGGFYCFALSQ